MDQETEKKAAETAEPAADAGKPENDEKIRSRTPQKIQKMLRRKRKRKNISCR